MSLFQKRAAGLALCTIFSVTSLYAQQSITGTVRDANGPIAGVSVSVKGTNRATQTNENGSFTIQASQGETLRISIVGYKPQEIQVNATKTIDVTLSNDDSSLDEVVVTALGIKREAKSLGYSVQKVGGRELTQTNAPTVATGLMGKVSGMNISMSNGVEGDRNAWLYVVQPH
ncbi:carboxypeptidase-like regulatory domain-containing protein [Sphingobacterium sp. E70]|uniref:carboxypeptidase-like regulatory domain-containing protein n=1 Tax=Sphingobacterium sp. E70 TaxID=2853439 RepID=UPI00211C08E2|nr:carboxypeptidase-like regulatory domain-containing protein [Sphingobacterium sp. E70]ULT27585.1 carboxypeptidase-like regulatory domain-containing protein [Sphingobacterium sp. E70]